MANPTDGRLGLSVVVPVYRAADCLEELHRRLSTVLKGMDVGFEIVLVDDRSPDRSWDVIATIAHADSAVKAIRLSRNFGQHAAITAGLEHATGRWVVVMDCDLQDPPEEIPRLYSRALSGFDIVLAKRAERQHSLFRRTAARCYVRILNAFNETTFGFGYGSFSIISRAVVDAFLKVHDRNRHYLFILYWLGFTTGHIEYTHAERFAGKSSYSLRRLIRHALDGLFFQTTVLLHWIVYLGFLVSAIGFTWAIYILYQYLTRSIYPGWTSLVMLILIIGGFIIISTGVTGLYIGKIFEQVKARPLYVVSQSIMRGQDQP